MDLKDFDFNKLDQKQKIMIPVAAALVVFILWQVMAMFGGGDDFADQPADTAAFNPGPGGPGGTFAEGQFPGQAGGPGVVNMQEVVTTDVQEIQAQPPTQEELAELENAKQMRRVYLTLLQQYQIATVQRMLAETRAAIAENDAKLSKQKLEKARSDAQANQLEGGAATFNESTGEVVMTTAGGETTEVDVVGPSDKFKLSYIGKRDGRWSAIIMLDSTHYDVGVGSKLPDDSEVMTINRDSVLLAKNMKRRLISLAATSKDMFEKPADTSGGTAEQAVAAGGDLATTGGFKE